MCMNNHVKISRLTSVNYKLMIEDKLRFISDFRRSYLFIDIALPCTGFEKI
jgi:hypothetical protein